MALTFPLSCPSFFQLLPIKEITFDCPEVLATTRTKGGEILTADCFRPVGPVCVPR